MLSVYNMTKLGSNRNYVGLVLLLLMRVCVCVGKYGVQKDRMDKSAVGHDYQADLSKHESQTDAAKGFGG